MSSLSSLGWSKQIVAKVGCCRRGVSAALLRWLRVGEVQKEVLPFPSFSLISSFFQYSFCIHSAGGSTVEAGRSCTLGDVPHPIKHVTVLTCISHGAITELLFTIK